MIGKIIVLAVAAIIIGLMIYAATGMYTNYVLSLRYAEAAGNYFELSDVATTPEKKIEYWDQYIAGLQKEGLHQGKNSHWNNGIPMANNENNFPLALDIRAKLVRWNEIDLVENPAGYKVLQEEITWQDYCWFPKHAFQQGYHYNNGDWFASLYPPGQKDFCAGIRPTGTPITATSK